MDDALFDIPDGARVQKPEPETPGAALRGRQLDKLQRGIHPLSKPGWPPIPLHKDAPPAGDRTAPGPRCGSCRFREVITPYNSRRRFPKCMLPDQHGDAWRASHSVASDVRLWWPGCKDYQPKTAEPGEKA